ncbi:MAG: tRNA pseudouridine(38-40) synthase TruA [Bacteroidetes bacterium]|nr:tRNA pseudouridine(38-40) synthase TruA [Bacteroidota bacterium]
MRYALELAYNGNGFTGWQRQAEGPGVQGTLENALSLILRHPAEVTGCGRTDTGVHARYFVAHFDSSEPVPLNLPYRLNSMLPPGIAIFSCHPVPVDFHARFSAISRSYGYYITHRKDPFAIGMKWYLPFQPDVDRMNEAAKLMLTHEEYPCFCKGKPPHDNYKCTVTHAEWSATESGLVFRISANRFLRSMVRSTVGTLLQVGFGKMTVPGFAQLLKHGTRSDAGKSVAPQGLYLEAVEYPEITGWEPLKMD